MTRLDQIYARLVDPDDAGSAASLINLLVREAMPEWLPTLHEWLETKDDDFLRAAAVPAIIKLEGLRCLPNLLVAHRLGLSEGCDNDTLDEYLFQLVEMNPVPAAAILLKLAKSAESQDRVEAAWLLDFISGEVGHEIFVELASDPSPEVRAAACSGLYHFREIAVAASAFERCLHDDDAPVRESAACAVSFGGE